MNPLMIRDLEYIPPRPFNDDEPEGQSESTKDYVLNNVWLADILLDLYGQGRIEIPEELK